MVYQNVHIRTITSIDADSRLQYGSIRRDRSDIRVAFFFFVNTKRASFVNKGRLTGSVIWSVSSSIPVIQHLLLPFWKAGIV